MSVAPDALDVVYLFCGGPSSEHRVSLNSSHVMAQQIRLDGRRVRPVLISASGDWFWSRECLESSDASNRAKLDPFFTAALDAPEQLPHTADRCTAAQILQRMNDEHVSCVLLGLHGTFGEDGRIQGFLESAGIPYTGSGVLGSACAMEKPVALEAFRRVGLRTPRGFQVEAHQVGEAAAKVAALNLEYPLFVKPSEGGSSVGTGPVASPAELEPALSRVFELSKAALVEEAVRGREISVGVVEKQTANGTFEPVALSPTEIQPVGAEFFDYDAKYTPGRCREITPAPLPPEVIATAQAAAVLAHQTLACAGVSRTDMIVPHNAPTEVVLLETNTLPGMTITSLLPQQARHAGIDFAELLEMLLAHGKARPMPWANR